MIETQNIISFHVSDDVPITGPTKGCETMRRITRVRDSGGLVSCHFCGTVMPLMLFKQAVLVD